MDFLIDILENTINEHVFGSVAGYMAGLPRMLAKNAILDVERKFPINSPDSRAPIRLIKEWSFEEYGKFIKPRLDKIAENESEPRVVPKILEMWGID